MGKAFGKQKRTIADQGKKKTNWYFKDFIKKEQEGIEGKFDDNEKQLKYKEVFNELSNEGIGEIYNISKEVDFNNLTCHFKGSNTAPINFIEFRGSMHSYNINS